MGRERRDTRRNQHKLVPTLEEGLEERAFTSTLTPASQFLQMRAAITAARAARAQGHVQGFTANSGRSRVITDVDRERYRADVLYLGVVRVQTAASAQAAIVVQGSGDSTELELKNVKPSRGAETAHSFPYNQTLYDGVLKVGLIDFASGRAKGVYGYGNIELTGPLNIKGTQDVQRIALLRLSPGATITTGGDLDTLDIYTDVTLSGAGTGIFVGRDLNAFNVNGNVTLTDGARIVVGRSVGLAPQPANGSGPGGQGFNIRGNLVIGPGSSLDIGRNIVGPIIVSGDLIGASRITVDGGPPTGGFIVGGQVVP
jgi:hypothetical protein